jgi:hypothetical protein
MKRVMNVISAVKTRKIRNLYNHHHAIVVIIIIVVGPAEECCRRGMNTHSSGGALGENPISVHM